ncbi:serine O-acetyltransferase [Methanofollis fontis]|uniref:Serine O-acetyltransferase n=1 Tax=Methanofollis fontis TaxID=2052832 RepID=A0A483CUC0_9EURY|nr:serine O-acetyltransferase [Methanofollis fontis]TAJ45186.1 serine O-acetyltransferase [Methanofollis fontis]
MKPPSPERIFAADIGRYFYSRPGRPDLSRKIRYYAHVTRYFVLEPGFRAIYFYRVNNRIVRNKIRFIGPFFRFMGSALTGIRISPYADIGSGLFIPNAQCIVIGYGVEIGKNVTIYQGVTIGIVPGKKRDERTTPIIGDNVMLGAGSKILGPVSIGDNSIIGANAVVVRDVPANSVATGVPAEVSGTVKVPYPQQLEDSG